MPREISEKTKKTMVSVKRLHNKGKGRTIKEIAKELHLSFSITFAYSKGFTSFIKYQEDLVRKQGFASISEYQKFTALRKDYREELLESAGYLSRIGYSIKDLREKRGELVVKLLEEREDFDKDFVETNFKDGLQDCLQMIGMEENRGDNKFKIFYKKNTVFIKTNNLKLSAFLSAYKLILGRELVK